MQILKGPLTPETKTGANPLLKKNDKFFSI